MSFNGWLHIRKRCRNTNWMKMHTGFGQDNTKSFTFMK